MRMSEQLESQIHETQARLQSIDNEMEAVQQAFLLKASNGEAYDAKAVVALEKDRSALQREREFLTLRLSALEAQRAEAIRSEAQERAAAIVTELNSLATEAGKATKRFDTLVNELTSLMQGARDRWRQYAELRDEVQYLALLHDLEMPTIPGFSAPDVQPLQSLYTESYSSLLSQANTLWSIKLSDLRQKRQEENARQQPKPQVQVQDNRPSVAKVLQHNEEARRAAHIWNPPTEKSANIMQRLLEN